MCYKVCQSIGKSRFYAFMCHVIEDGYLPRSSQIYTGRRCKKHAVAVGILIESCYNTSMTYDYRDLSKPERNPITYQKHRHEVFWQITIPLMAGGLILLSVAIFVLWAGITGAGDTSKLAGVSLIWLISIAMVISLLLILASVALVYVMTKLLHTVPPYAAQAQDALFLLGLRIKKASDLAVEPILRFQGLVASLRAARRNIRRGL